MHLVTPLISYMVNSPDFTKKELADVHAIIAAAAPIGKSIINRFLDKADKYIFFQEGYGMTELSPVCLRIFNLMPSTMFQFSC